MARSGMVSRYYTFAICSAVAAVGFSLPLTAQTAPRTAPRPAATRAATAVPRTAATPTTRATTARTATPAPAPAPAVKTNPFLPPLSPLTASLSI